MFMEFVSLTFFLFYRNIYLGETFSCCLCVHNDGNEVIREVSIKVNILYEYLEMSFKYSSTVKVT